MGILRPETEVAFIHIASGVASAKRQDGMLQFFKGFILMKTSQLQLSYLRLDPRFSVWILGLVSVFASWANLAFIFTYLHLVWFQITKKQRDRKYEREVKRHRHRGQTKKVQYVSIQVPEREESMWDRNNLKKNSLRIFQN